MFTRQDRLRWLGQLKKLSLSKPEQRLATEIFQVLLYVSQFQYPLTLAQLQQRLAVSSDLKTVQKLVKLLISQQLLVQSQPKKGLSVAAATITTAVAATNLITFSGQAQFFEIRQQRAAIARHKYQQLDEFLVWAKTLSWIKVVAVTGSLATDNAQEDADLDLLLVTASHRLWLTRLLVLVLAQLKGKRPGLSYHKIAGEAQGHWQVNNINNAWDFNLWLDEQALALPVTKQSRFEAFELLQVRCLYDPAQTWPRLLQRNAWLKTWAPNFWQKVDVEAAKIDKANKTDQINNGGVVSIFLNWLLVSLNYLAFMLESLYRTLRFGSQDAHLHAAFFHQPASKLQLTKIWQTAKKIVS